MARTLIHIGMPRAASTLFQQEVFPLIEDFHFEGVQRCHYSLPFQEMMYQDDSLYDANAFAKSTGDLRQANAFLSNELLVGQSLYLNATNRSRNMARLAAAFPEGEVVLFLRNQLSLLQSLYSIGIYAGHTDTPDGFVRFKHLYDTFAPTEHADNYLYTSLLTSLLAHFSKVQVFLFESFQADPQGFLTEFAERLQIDWKAKPVIGTKINRSFSKGQIEAIRRLNKLRPMMARTGAGRILFRKRLQKLERSLQGGPAFQFDDDLQSKIIGHFRKDNEKLMELLPQLKESPTFARHYLR